MKASPITISIEITGADEAIEKMNRIKELLSEVNSQIDSLNKININISRNSEKKRIADIAEDSQNQLLNGEKTLNQIRKEYGLEPINNGETHYHNTIL